jgi:ATP-dependent Clp protease ATP-binding subunit ClpA
VQGVDDAVIRARSGTKGHEASHRPLKRFLQCALATPLSRELIGGEITDNTRVTVDFKKGELVFEAKAVKEQGSKSRV